MERCPVNPVILQAELVRLEAKHGPALRALLGAIHRVAVDLGRPYDNWHQVQSLARELGCGHMAPVLADLELAGLVHRHKGDIHFPTDQDYRQDQRVVSIVKELLAAEQPSRGQVTTELSELPPGLFGDIIGHEEVKEILRAAVAAPRPVHVLLVGPPALAKSLFLWELEEALGESCWWALGSTTSRAGLMEILLDRRPWLVLVDEMDKMDGRDMAALLSAMEGGRLSRTKAGRLAQETLQVRVVAAANSACRLPPELLSRFAIRPIHPYTGEEFREVVLGVLTRREGTPWDIAQEIASRLGGRTQDVRDAIRVARLAPQLGVSRAIELLLRAGGNPLR